MSSQVRIGISAGSAPQPRADATRRARALARRLAALEEGLMRSRAAARAIAAEDPAGAAELLDAAARMSRQGDTTLAAAFGQALLDPGAELRYDHVAAIYAAAVERGLEEARALLVVPAPRRAYAPPRDRADPALAEMTFGHKKALARARRDPDLLARLAAEGDPSVLSELLDNPRLTEPLAVRIAAQRPCRPEALRMIAGHRRWRSRRAVARAVAMNPYAEPEVVLKILPALGGVTLAAIAGDGALHALVRASARRLAAVRPGGDAAPPGEEGKAED